jgi:hypothetical protein
MSHLRRLAVLTSAAAASVAALLALGTAAQAADTVRVDIRGLASNVEAGGNPAGFRAIFTTNSGALSGVRAVIAVQLGGAPPDSVHLSSSQGGDLALQGADNGSFVFNDPDPFDVTRVSQQSRREYVLTFGANAPLGDAHITVTAILDGQSLGSADTSIRVVALGQGHDGGPQFTTAPNTDPGIVPTYSAGPTYSIVALPGPASSGHVSATVPKSLYVLGSLLAALGVATLLLIFRAPGRVPVRAAKGAQRVNTAPSWHPRGEPAGHPGPQAWPTVGRPAAPRRPVPADAGQFLDGSRTVRDPGPPRATGRSVRDSGPGDALPPRMRP